MSDADYPILEYDDSPTAIIEPDEVIGRRDGMPEHVVLCFFNEVIEAVCGDGKADVVYTVKSEAGAIPTYAFSHEGQRVAVVQPGIGAPFGAGVLEEVIAAGGRKFVACGGAGVLDGEIAVGHVIIPTSAVRDEGTSYHYLPPGREVAPDAAAVEAIKHTLDAHGIPYLEGKTWTTDGIYRETRPKVARRRAEGCITVEMEAAAFFAVAQFRGVAFGQILYGGDDVSGEVWDNRNWIHGRASTREQLLWLAVDAVLRL
jgi:uridine phosphorylase